MKLRVLIKEVFAVFHWLTFPLYIYIYIYVCIYIYIYIMGSYNGSEVCKLSGIFKLSLIGNKYNPNNIGLYRNDRLAIF